MLLPYPTQVQQGIIFTSVCLSTRGACMAGGHVWHGGVWWGTCMVGGMHGDGICLAGGHVWQGACMVARGVHGTGGHVWLGSVHGKGGMHGRGACVAAGVCLSTRGRGQERRPLQRTVRILLECILVYTIFLSDILTSTV